MSVVTIFAARDDLTSALADEIVARGSSAHTVTVASGWVGTATRAVILLDSEAGRSAVEELCTRDQPTMQVITLGARAPEGDVARWCLTCGEHHHLVFEEIDPSDLEQVARVAEAVTA